jgi:hypothetical protein
VECGPKARPFTKVGGSLVSRNSGTCLCPRRYSPTSESLTPRSPAHPGIPLPVQGSHPRGSDPRLLRRAKPPAYRPRDPAAAPGAPPRDPAHVTPAPSPARARPSGPWPPHLAGALHGVREGVLADPRATPTRRLRGAPGRPTARTAAAGATAASVPRARWARGRASSGTPGSPAPACGGRRPGRGSSCAVVRHGAAGPGLVRRLKLRRRRRWRRRLNAGTRPRSTRPQSTLGTQRLGRRRWGGLGRPLPRRRDGRC